MVNPIFKYPWTLYAVDGSGPYVEFRDKDITALIECCSCAHDNTQDRELFEQSAALERKLKTLIKDR